jgi:hypothetical protein
VSQTRAGSIVTQFEMIMVHADVQGLESGNSPPDFFRSVTDREIFEIGRLPKPRSGVRT